MTELQVLPLYRFALFVLLEHVNGLRLTMQDHQSRFVTTRHSGEMLFSFVINYLMVNTMRIQSNKLFR